MNNEFEHKIGAKIDSSGTLPRRWYVLQVSTGEELSVMTELHRRGVAAIVPLENRAIRSKGKWTTRKYVIFPGYVFINMKYSWSQYYIMSGIKGIIRLLGGGNSPEPLSENDVELIIKDTELFAEPSVLKFNDDGSYEIISGVLLKLKDNIKKLDRHARRATVEIMLAGKKTEIKLSFSIRNEE